MVVIIERRRLLPRVSFAANARWRQTQRAQRTMACNFQPIKKEQSVPMDFQLPHKVPRDNDTGGYFIALLRIIKDFPSPK